jgi:signal transduction histidine kinase
MNLETQNFHILYVDDAVRNFPIMAGIFKSEGCKLSFAVSGEDALEQTRNEQFDLILLDIIMPDMDGYETCRRLQNNFNTRAIPVIFLTEKTDTQSLVKGFEVGAQDFITKPFKPLELLARVKTHLKLKDALSKLNKTIATRDKFFAIISHDLKGPFNAILGYSQLLSDDYDLFDDTERKSFITDMHNASKRLYSMVENLLDWSRIQSDKIEWRPGMIGLRQIINSALITLKTQADAKHIRICFDIGREIRIFGDADMLTLVVPKLLSTAIKYTHEGGQITIECRSGDGFQEVTIADKGVGIAAENIKKLFRTDIHYVTSGTLKEIGTGLGLILCREFVERNGGLIQVESEVGKGSRFTFTVPQNPERRQKS